MWAAEAHFFCEAPRANSATDPVIVPAKIFDNVYAIGNSGTTVTVTIQVRDAATLQAVADASVVLRTDLPGATITPSSGKTNAAGVFTASFTGTVKQGMTYQIIAEVSKAGYADASDSASLAVRSVLGEVPVVQTTRNVPGFEAAAAVGAVALAFALVALARRRRED